MTIKELKHLRNEVHKRFIVMTTDPMTGEPRHRVLSEYNPLMKLIDAQIERQEDVVSAMSFVIKISNRMIEIDEELMKIFGESNRHWNLIVDALRAYRKPEPCEWCRDKHSDDFECSTYSEFEDGDDGFWETMGAITRCPKCGRVLEGEA